MKYFIIVIPFLLCFFSKAQEDNKQSLIVVQVEPGWGNKFRQQILSYHFLNGIYVGRDQIIRVTGKVEGEDLIRTDIGNNFLYKDRYLITGIGNIIDLDEKKVLFDGKGKLIRCENDSAVFYTNDIFKGKFYSVYNFKTKKYGIVKSLVFKPIVGQEVEFDKTSAPFKLYYYPQGKTKEVLTTDAGFGQPAVGKYPPDPPIFWIDQNQFVYGWINKESTELAIYRLSVNSKEKKLIGKAAITPEKEPATISKIDEKGLVLNLGTKQILIDLSKEALIEMEFTRPYCGFSFECQDNDLGRSVKLNDQQVGTFQFKPMNFKADKNIAALVKEIRVGNETYQQGLAVWDNIHKTWITVDCEEVLSLVGWINR